MNAQIEKDFQFQAGLYFDKTLLLNTYSFTAFMEVSTDSIREQNIAMQRVEHFLFEKLEHSIFVKDSEKKVIDKLIDAGFAVGVLPEEPFDQIIALVLISKLNALTEGRLIVTSLTMSSRLSDGVRFTENRETANHVLGQNGWWKSGLPKLSLPEKHKTDGSKVVKMQNNEWIDLGLSWKDKSQNNNEIVFDPEKQ